MSEHKYTVTEEDIERMNLDQEDLGREFIIVQGTVQFVSPSSSYEGGDPYRDYEDKYGYDFADMP